MQIELTETELHIIAYSLNVRMHATSEKLKTQNLGDLERKIMEAENLEIKKLLMKIAPLI